MLSGSCLATSLLSSSSVLPVAPDVDPSGSRGVEAVSFRLQDVTVDNGPREARLFRPLQKMVEMMWVMPKQRRWRIKNRGVPVSCRSHLLLR